MNIAMHSYISFQFQTRIIHYLLYANFQLIFKLIDFLHEWMFYYAWGFIYSILLLEKQILWLYFVSHIVGFCFLFFFTTMEKFINSKNDRKFFAIFHDTIFLKIQRYGSEWVIEHLMHNDVFMVSVDEILFESVLWWLCYASITK